MGEADRTGMSPYASRERAPITMIAAEPALRSMDKSHEAVWKRSVSSPSRFRRVRMRQICYDYAACGLEGPS